MEIQINKIYQSDIEQVLSCAISWEFLSNKTVLIVGATGMIPSVIIDILMLRNKEFSQHIHIIAISRSEEKAKRRFAAYWDDACFTYISHDITTPLLETGDIDYILHAASNTHPRAYAADPIGTITANVQGTYHLLNMPHPITANAFSFFLCGNLWRK